LRVWGVDVSYCYALFIRISLTYRGRFTSNAEYAMLLVYVLMIKWILKKWCTPKLFVFVCYLLCYVLCLPYSVIIPVLHHGLIWLLAFLRNRFWLKDNSNSLTLSRNENRYSCVFTIISHCASFNIVCGLHPGNMLSDKKLEYCLLFEHRYIWSLPSFPRPSSTSDTVLSFLFIENKKPHVWLYCFNFHPVWPLKTTIDNIPWNWQKK